MEAELPLRTIHLPAEIGWWPLAWGWWLLIALLLVGLSVLGWYGWRYYLKRLPIQHALQELTALEQRYTQDHRGLVQALSTLLRRVAMQQHGRMSVAGLTGKAWARFLQQQGMSAELAHALSEMPYRPIEQVDTRQLIHQVKLWITQQRAKSGVTPPRGA